MSFTLNLLLIAFALTLFTPLHNTRAEDAEPQDVILDEDIKVAKKTYHNTVKDEEEAISEDGFSVADRKLLRTEDHHFQAEINRLLGLIVNSLYSNREIFVRELISNAADAMSKIRFLSLTDPSILGETTNFEIKIKPEPEKALLHIRDTGIGMTKDDLINNLGSIAKSGTKEFFEKFGASSDASQIGQFGVGFYSSFLVADRVTVTSKHNNDEQYIWESGADETSAYTVAKDPRGNTLGRGTLITLHLKEDARQFLDPETLKKLILKYNEFISYPIYLWESHEEEVAEPKEKVPNENEELEVEEEEEEEEVQPEKKKVWAFERVNVYPPLWTRPKSEITETEYIDFYKNVLKDSNDPIFHSHFKAEGEVEFTSLLYCPDSLPIGYFEVDFKPNLRLYVKRVFITDDFTEMLPSYLNFIKGIVDSDDLDLNVSRELLQQSKNLSIIKKKLVRKIIAEIQDLAENHKEKYDKFYKAFGNNLKMGIVQDYGNKGRISKLLRFTTAKHTEEAITLDQYIKEFRKNQKDIYFLGGESKNGIIQSPLLEKITKKGYDVLLLTDPLDEYAVNTLGKYDGKYSFVDIGKEGLKLDDENKAELKAEFKPLCDFLKNTLSDRLEKVEISTRLTTSPTALVTPTSGHSANMERIFKAQALQDKRYATLISKRRVLEINPRHPIVRSLKNELAILESDTIDSEINLQALRQKLNDVAIVLYDSAVLNSGYALDKPQELTNKLLKVIQSNMGIADEVEEEPEIVEEEEEEAPEEKDEEIHEEL